MMEYVPQLTPTCTNYVLSELIHKDICKVKHWCFDCSGNYYSSLFHTFSNSVLHFSLSVHQTASAIASTWQSLWEKGFWQNQSQQLAQLKMHYFSEICVYACLQIGQNPCQRNSSLSVIVLFFLFVFYSQIEFATYFDQPLT